VKAQREQDMAKSPLHLLAAMMDHRGRRIDRTYGERVIFRDANELGGQNVSSRRVNSAQVRPDYDRALNWHIGDPEIRHARASD
jgi:hypothetical protein